MAIIVKNTTNETKTWGGITINALSQYSLQPTDTIKFLSDTSFQSDLQLGYAVINDGTTDLNVVSGTLHMQGYVPPIIKGGTNGASIGNSGDRLKVDADITSISGVAITSFDSKLRVDILDTAISLSTGSYTTVYTYSGSGFLHGFNIEFNNVGVITKLQVDGETIFDGVTINELNSFIGTGNDASRRQMGSGIVTTSGTIDFSMKHSIKFFSNITISADANGGGLLSRKFERGLIYISKVT